MGKLGMGVLGVGEMGRRHAENIRRLVPQAQLVAIADVDAHRAKQVAGELEIEHSYSSLDAMLERKDIHCVVIATPDKFHADAVRAAAKAGKDILCEKPLALNLEDAHAALEAVSHAGVRLQIGFMRRYDPAYVAAKKQIDVGEIGEPVIFKSIGRDKDAPPIGYYKSRMNGMLFFASSIHDFDLARWLMKDEVAEIHAYTTVAIRPELEQYDDIVAGVVNLKYKRGAIGNIESYAQCIYGYDVRTEVIGSKGSILVGSLQQAPATFLKSNGGSYDIADHFLSRFADAYLAEIRDFVDNMLNDREPRVTGIEGLRAVEIAVAAQNSSLNAIACAVSQGA
ncbi:MAG TPA: Gfo/Idh/MocA family oxidoreductase [Candidatus Acidoferrum sp.]|nr:Gfo/Idh/MocA family oxidoreductase [Candidatus Acidoferrum sp.]